MGTVVSIWERMSRGRYPSVQPKSTGDQQMVLANVLMVWELGSRAMEKHCKRGRLEEYICRWPYMIGQENSAVRAITESGIGGLKPITTERSHCCVSSFFYAYQVDFRTGQAATNAAQQSPEAPLPHNHQCTCRIDSCYHRPNQPRDSIG